MFIQPAVSPWKLQKLCASALLIFLIFVVGGCVTGKIEEPKYIVVKQDGVFELREYEERIVAETIVEGSFKDAPNVGFRRLADFIFGNNVAQSKVAMTAPVSQEPTSQKIAMTAPVSQESVSEEIAMTAPVSQESSAAGRWRITFTMPKAYTIETLPRPNNPAVTIRTLPATRFAVVRFSGRNRQSTVDEKTAELRNWAATQGLKDSGNVPLYARYDPPWVLWFWRRNEILIEVE